MTMGGQLRSRVTGNCQARFWSRAVGATPALRLTYSLVGSVTVAPWRGAPVARRKYLAIGQLHP